MLKRLVFPIAIVSMIAPLTVWSDYFARDHYFSIAIYGHVVGMLGMLAGILIFYKPASIPPRPALLPFALFVLWALVSTSWSINRIDSATSTLVLLIYATTIFLFWKEPPEERARIFLWAGWTFFLSLLLLPLTLPINDRGFGGVNPNTVAHCALAGLFCFIVAGRFQRIAIAITTVIVLFSQARGALVGLALFLLMYYLFLPFLWTIRSRALGLGLMVSASAVAVLSYATLVPFLVTILSRITGIQTESRIGADLTGRTQVWQIGLDYIAHRPLLGYGFRTRSSADLAYLDQSFSAHSGLLNVALDLGIVGGLLFVLWYLSALFTCFDVRGRYQRETVIATAAFLTASMTFMIVEPNYISFAHPSSFVLLICLLCPIALRETRRAPPDVPTAIYPAAARVPAAHPAGA